MTFDALILTGGRGRRLGGISKAGLVRDGRTLLDLALSSTVGARTTVVVGDGDPDAGYALLREIPAFSGPVAAIAAGLRSLGPDHLSRVLILACDMPDASTAVSVLRGWMAEHESSGVDGVIAVDDDGQDQFLLGIYSTEAILRRLSTMVVENASMKELIAGLQLHRVNVPHGATNDVDTWQDAAALGVTM
jgi:molybdopterin-guanine dinucleotide biosynthesis protein A